MKIPGVYSARTASCICVYEKNCQQTIRPQFHRDSQIRPVTRFLPVLCQESRVTITLELTTKAGVYTHKADMATSAFSVFGDIGDLIRVSGDMQQGILKFAQIGPGGL